MKLVTGIEAVRSGRPFRFVFKESGKPISYGSWITRTARLGNLTSEDFVSQSWEIEQEPREFWVDISSSPGGYLKACSIDHPTMEPGADGWIKCREVIE